MSRLHPYTRVALLSICAILFLRFLITSLPGFPSSRRNQKLLSEGPGESLIPNTFQSPFADPSDAVGPRPPGNPIDAMPGKLLDLDRKAADRINSGEKDPRLKNPLFGPRFNVQEQFTEEFLLGGQTFNETGVSKQLEFTMSTSLLHSFSPQSEDHFRNIMIDPVKELKIYANSPAIVWHRGELRVALRMWLRKESWYEAERDHADNAPINSYLDNYMYLQRFDDKLRPLAPGYPLGIPTPTQWSYGEGPLEPRMFVRGGRLYLSYNAGVMRNKTAAVDTTFLWDFQRRKSIMPKFTDGPAPMERRTMHRIIRDKHWIPFDDSSDPDPDALYFTYNIDPLRVIMINSTNGATQLIYSEGPYIYPFTNPKDIVRGGTPFMEYKHPYYISLGHGTLFLKQSYDRIYIAFILVLRAERPNYKIVYKSHPIKLHKSILELFPIVRDTIIKEPFIFPMSLILEDEDTCAFGTHVNDGGSVLVRMRGIKRLMESVMAADAGTPCKGSPVGTLHNVTRDYMTDLRHLEFVNE